MDLLITAKKIADRVEAESLKQNVPVAVTVINTHGNVVLIHRMTGAPRSAIFVVVVRTRTSSPRSERWPAEGANSDRPFEYVRADDVAAAVALVTADPRAEYLAGGTTELDLVLKDGVLDPERLVDIRRLPLCG